MSQINLEELLKCPIRKTSNSYARVYDAYVPVDEIDESTRKPLKKIASLRTIIYLEDLGPINESKGLLQEKNEEFENEQLKEFKKEGPVFIPEPITNLDNNEDDSEKVYFFLQKNSN